jgi:hypothetical protein
MTLPTRDDADWVDELALRPGRAVSGPVEAVTLVKKNRQCLARPGGAWYCFSEMPAAVFAWAAR